MTDQEINIAIAEACGWRVDATSYHPNKRWISPAGNVCIWCSDYCHDLNAMHEAETWLSGHQWADYFEWLQKHGKATGTRATARERAEGFLRAKGLWKP